MNGELMVVPWENRTLVVPYVPKPPAITMIVPAENRTVVLQPE